MQVRKFAFEQYAASGLAMHPGFSPVAVVKQANGLLTCVLADKDGNKMEITDNDHVRAWTCVCGGEGGRVREGCLPAAAPTRRTPRRPRMHAWLAHSSTRYSLRALDMHTSLLDNTHTHTHKLRAQVMMATGRVPKIQNLGLEEVGVKLGAWLLLLLPGMAEREAVRVCARAGGNAAAGTAGTCR
jgi:hypothetical protein